VSARFEGAREAEFGVAVARSGDLERARRHLARAVKAQPRNPEHHYNLGIVHRNAGESDADAACLTRALRCKPGHGQAARRLSALLVRYALSTPEELDRYGLKAALASPGIDRQPVVDAAIDHLRKASGLGELLEHGARDGWREAGRKLLAGGSGGLLKNELLLLALAEGVNRDPELERLLTAVRALVLRETEDERFADKAVRAFVCALIRQCLNNEWVFYAAPEELSAVARLSVEREAFLAGDNAAARTFMRRALYMPLEEALEGLPEPEECGRIRPAALRELVTSYAARRARERELARSLPAIGATGDETSRRVAGQYEENLYPRWTSL
jgi:tetratricopeptide (TPR) repeat protein